MEKKHFMEEWEPHSRMIRWPPSNSKADEDRLHTAILMGNCRKIKKLVKNGVSPDLRNSAGQTGLYIGAILGKKGVINTLLKMGAEVNGRCLPGGYTALHGACYIGSLDIIRTLIAEGGDLRLCDVERQRPADWIEIQDDVNKRRKTREFIDKLRFCITMNDIEKMKKELKGRVRCLGRSQPKILQNIMRKCGRNKDLIDEIRSDQILSTGFGKVYFVTGKKCVDAVGLASVSEMADLKYDTNPRAPSWINGRFSTFVPMIWETRNTSVVCKTLRHKSVEEAVPDVLIAELRVLVRLQHPQILMVLAVCQEDNFDSLSLVFEKVGMGSLYFFLHQQNLRMKSTFATEIVMQISEALDYIHGSGFIHCGISSHAIMLVNENQAKLACFEYAIPENESDSEKFLFSRHPWLASDSHLSVIRHWMAPEVLIGANKHTQASDVYSLCAVMWELVVGDMPWSDQDLHSLRELFKNSPGLQLPLRKDIIPPVWLSVLKVGLKRKWEERDLDFKEVRYMMALAKERSSAPSVGGGGDRSVGRVSGINPIVRSSASPVGGGGGGDRKSLSRGSILSGLNSTPNIQNISNTLQPSSPLKNNRKQIIVDQDEILNECNNLKIQTPEFRVDQVDANLPSSRSSTHNNNDDQLGGIGSHSQSYKSEAFLQMDT